MTIISVLRHLFDDMSKHSIRKYLLKDKYDGTEVACYDQID